MTAMFFMMLSMFFVMLSMFFVMSMIKITVFIAQTVFFRNECTVDVSNQCKRRYYLSNLVWKIPISSRWIDIPKMMFL
uniref:ATP synthase F0 subunit 8 n=1 Tax=Acrobeloides nanus TaxID=290746 RepID=A0A914DIA1_9BILA